MEVISDNQPPLYARFLPRFAAFLIDSIIMYFIQLIIVMPFLAFVGISAVFSPIDIDMLSDEEKVAMLASMIGGIIILSLFTAIAGWLYFALMESSFRQGTIGKIALGLRVTDLNGERISFLRATGRYFGKILSGMILMIGYLMAAFTDKKQALHDLLSGCLVLRNKPS